MKKEKKEKLINLCFAIGAWMTVRGKASLVGDYPKMEKADRIIDKLLEKLIHETSTNSR